MAQPLPEVPPSKRAPVVDVYMRTSAGMIAVSCSAALSGGLLGALVSAYLVHQPKACLAAGVLVGFFGGIFGGNLGELFRALGVALLLTLSRWRTFTGQYPIIVQLKALLVRRRRRFPPNAPPNLYRYQPTPEQPLPFSMYVCLLSAGLLGILGGWSTAKASHAVLPSFLVPPSLVGLASGGFTAFVATQESMAGDLLRCGAMKTVGAVRLVCEAGVDCQVPAKTLALGGQVAVKAQAMDKRYRISERVVGFVGAAAAKASGGGGGGGGGSGGSRRGAHGAEGGSQRRRRKRSSQGDQRKDAQSGPQAEAPQFPGEWWETSGEQPYSPPSGGGYSWPDAH